MTISNLMKMAEISPNGLKTLWERRNCSFRAISPFPTVFSKDLYCRQVKTRACLQRVNRVENVARKGENAGYPQCFHLPSLPGQQNPQIELTLYLSFQNFNDLEGDMKTQWEKEKIMVPFYSQSFVLF